ncbi:MAG: hypothetical protein ACR2FY_14125 [Pirellulaceae bacterium]
MNQLLRFLYTFLQSHFKKLTSIRFSISEAPEGIYAIRIRRKSVNHSLNQGILDTPACSKFLPAQHLRCVSALAIGISLSPAPDPTELASVGELILH